MDDMSAQVIEKICTLAPLGRYVILSADDFSEEIGDSGLRKSLKTLKDDGYIDLKYSSGDLFCVAPLKAFVREEQSDEAAPEEIPVEEPRRNFSSFALTFLSAFLGGALGSLIISLIFSLT